MIRLNINNSPLHLRKQPPCVINYLILIIWILSLQQLNSFLHPNQPFNRIYGKRFFDSTKSILDSQTTKTTIPQSDKANSRKIVKVVIAGGGPAGLLTALTLLNRNVYYPSALVEYQIHLLESNEDPRITPPGPRSYPLGLGLRGQYVLQSFEQGSNPRWQGLWKHVQQIGIDSDRLFIHLNKWKIPIRQPADPSIALSQPLIAVNTTKSLLIQRNRLCSVFLSFLQEQHSEELANGKLQISFDKKIESIDFQGHSVGLVSGERLSYDLLIGCDGVNSAVRRSLQTHVSSIPKNSSNSFQSEDILLPSQFKVMSQPIPSNLEADAIHAFPDLSRFLAKSPQTGATSGFSLFAIPTITKQLATVINWRRDSPPSFLTYSNLSSVSDSLLKEIEEVFEKQYPSFGKPTREAIAQLTNQLPSNFRKVRCNCYHYTPGKVVLIGDAVHATDATWGQGLSATFLDIFSLDKCLTEANDDLSVALPNYSSKQVKEGLALWQLIALPPKGLIGLFYSVSQVLIGLARTIPWFGRILPLPIQYLISKTIMPYSEIVKKNEYWTNVATKGQAYMEYNPERN